MYIKEPVEFVIDRFELHAQYFFKVPRLNSRSCISCIQDIVSELLQETNFRLSNIIYTNPGLFVKCHLFVNSNARPCVSAHVKLF